MTMMNPLATSASPWLAFHKAQHRPDVRLFCFPYAGGGALIYNSWSEGLSDNIEVCPVQLPGRGSRMGEPAYTHVAPLVRTLSHVIGPFLDKPFAFFGHSMGAVIAFELAQHLRREHGFEPVHLFVSARRAPHLPVSGSPIYDLPEPEFLEELRRLNGTPREVLEHRELMSLMLPTIRADFSICQTYDYMPKPPLDCPITAFGGLQDGDVTREQLEAWRNHTSDEFSLRMVPGDHFYLQTARPHLLSVISRNLQEFVDERAVA